MSTQTVYKLTLVNTVDENSNPLQQAVLEETVDGFDGHRSRSTHDGQPIDYTTAEVFADSFRAILWPDGVKPVPNISLKKRGLPLLT